MGLDFRELSRLFAQDEVYQDLMEKLSDVPREMIDIGQRLVDAKMAVKSYQDALATEEAMIVHAEGGWSGLGKNEGDRKTRLQYLLSSDENYDKARNALARAEQDVAELNQEYDGLSKVLQAVQHQSRLHGTFVMAMSSVRIDIPTGEMGGEAAEELEF